MNFNTLFDKNIFNQKSYADMTDDATGAYQIQIIPTDNRTHGVTSKADWKIKGVLTDKVSINVNAEWETFGFGGLINNFQWLQTAYKWFSMAHAFGGGNIDNIGLVTKKFFRKGDYLKISPHFRVVDWNGEGWPVQAAQLLINMCSPQKVKNIKDVIAVAGRLAKPLTDKIPGPIKEGATEILQGISELPDKFNKETGLDTGVGQGTQGKFSDALNNSLWLTASPPPVMVSIGNWFNHSNMIIEGVSVDFSEQMTAAGPMYVDLGVNLSSQEVMSIDENGFTSTGMNARVTSNLDTAKQ